MADQFSKEFNVKKWILDFAETCKTLSLNEKNRKKLSYARKLSYGFKNPFRVFTSLLRLDLITDETLRFLAKSLLSRRQIFTEGLITLIETCENNKMRLKELRELFPEGYRRGACRVAGLPFVA